MAVLSDLDWHIGRKGLSLLVPPVWSPGKDGGGGTPPTAPSALTATADGGYQRINLSWTDNSNNEAGFKIERSDGDELGYSQIDTVAAGVVTYEDTGLARGEIYYYKVRAYNGGGDSDYTTSANDTVFDFDDVATLKLLLLSDVGTWQDAGKSTPADDDAEDIYTWEDQSGNGYDVIQATAADRPAVETGLLPGGRRVIHFDGTEFLGNATLANWKFLHDGSDWYGFVLHRIANQSNGVYGLFGTNGTSSASIGAAHFHDDRSSQTRNNRGILQITKGSLGNPIIYMLSWLPAGGWTISTPTYDNGNAGDDGNLRLLDVLQAGSGDSINTPHSAANPTYGLDIGAAGNGALILAGHMAAVVLYQATPSAADTTKIVQCLADYYGMAVPFDNGANATTRIQNDSDYDIQCFAVVADDGDVIEVFRRGTQHDVETAGKISKAVWNGATWTQSDIVDSASYDDRNAAGGIASTGTILLFYGRYDVGGGAWFDMRCMRSTNDGDTFTDIGTAMSDRSQTVFSPYGPLVELPSGKLMQTFYGNDGTNYLIWVSFSDDDGATWGNEVNISSSAALFHTECAAAYVSGATDGAAKIILVARFNNSFMAQYSSSNGGATWASDGLIPFSQGSGTDTQPWLYKYGDHIILVYADRTDKQIKFSARRIDSTITDVSAWQAPVPLVPMDGNTTTIAEFGSPAVIEYGGQLEYLYNDGSSAHPSDPDILYSW